MAETESIAALSRSGAHRLLQPARYGGLAETADEFVSAVCELAMRDGSLGWLATAFNAAAHELAGLPEPVLDEVWGADPEALIATTFRGRGELGRDRTLTGRWESVVGAEYAQWLLLPADDGGPVRVLVPCSAVRLEPPGADPGGLDAAGICDVELAAVEVDDRHVFSHRDEPAVIAVRGAVAAVVGSADGVWRKHVDQVRERLATSSGGDDVSDAAAAQVAWAASDIDAARVQVTSPLEADDLAAAIWVHRQAVARARDAADRLLANSRHALDASDPVTLTWRDVHAGCRLAAQLVDGLESAAVR
jgi:3-hydroxy-9,10-secoandrosta-1,3,5(10)-triene-9,17-dione monooxygenase